MRGDSEAKKGSEWIAEDSRTFSYLANAGSSFLDRIWVWYPRKTCRRNVRLRSEGRDERRGGFCKTRRGHWKVNESRYWQGKIIWQMKCMRVCYWIVCQRQVEEDIDRLQSYMKLFWLCRGMPNAIDETFWVTLAVCSVSFAKGMDTKPVRRWSALSLALRVKFS